MPLCDLVDDFLPFGIQIQLSASFLLLCFVLYIKYQAVSSAYEKVLGSVSRGGFATAA